jgi:hypothetical protein
MSMSMIRNVLQSMICGTLALLVSYVTLGPIMQPATLVAISTLPVATALHADVAGRPA